MIMARKMQHSMYYQKGQLMCKGHSMLFCLTLRLRVGNNNLSQRRKLVWWHHEFKAGSVFGRFFFTFPMARMVC